MTPFGRATLALRLLALDPAGLGGIVLRARPGPARDAFLRFLPSDALRLHPALSLDALDGGIDVAASLADGTMVRHKGLLETNMGFYVLTMAERCPPLMVARLCTVLDSDQGHSIIALDEGAEEDEKLPASLADRLAFHISLEGLGHHDVEPLPDVQGNVMPEAVEVPGDLLTELVTLAVVLGIHSLRAPSLALRAAQANAALNQRKMLHPDDVLIAAELVYAPRATRLPQEKPEEQEAAPQEQPDPQQTDTETLSIPQDILLAAIKTALPPDLLENSCSNKGKTGTGSGAGRKRIGNRRGRPLPAREGPAKGANPRVDLMATLRAAVPWQTLRKTQGNERRNGPIIYPSDLRYRRFEDLSDRLLIFAVDASGSAALARLAEAKGAVELLLAEAYARRDHVSLVSFRGDGAETLLPPTRSLVQTKRRLAELPGGGGTPLAAGLQVGLETAIPALRKGLTPVLIVLTDGRSNVALDGTPDRAQAAKDATQIAQQIAQTGMSSIVIDTGRRPERSLRQLAETLGGRYVSLPRADARSLSDTILTSLEA